MMDNKFTNDNTNNNDLLDTLHYNTCPSKDTRYSWEKVLDEF